MPTAADIIEKLALKPHPEVRALPRNFSRQA